MGGGIRSVATAALAAALALAACTSDEPRPVGSPGEVPNERVSTDDALPAEFPDDFPLPGTRTVLYSAVSPVGVVAYFKSESQGEALKGVILAGLRANGWRLHSCHEARGGPEPVTTIVAGKARMVATAVIGYSPASASRIQGRVYSFFVSVATDADAPPGTADSC